MTAEKDRKSGEPFAKAAELLAGFVIIIVTTQAKLSCALAASCGKSNVVAWNLQCLRYTHGL